ncbi:MAG: KH domain-containing protein [Armatimonadota bacterium]|nr:KH domain-containing protein [Armatimonadota bacterium]MDR7449337.1 KH domain-containing protein [Armatimonadota bacterium]MDR7458784.1 KH domain-containing protein [Armatimonadota bacterium]MDR7480002.1 KH domain-containing protein [Armatimonadota bacterium]MDR7488608.1 KH domain-containing protein [Armatimonadota bacterium]
MSAGPADDPAEAGRRLADLVGFIARGLVDRPEAVHTEARADARGTVVTLRVAPDDMGKVIGRQGRIARSLRAVVRAAGQRWRTHAHLAIHQEGDAGAGADRPGSPVGPGRDEEEDPWPSP